MDRFEFMRTIEEGGYGKFRGEWYVRPPGIPFAARLSEHTVTEHDDGTITVSPSILYEGGSDYNYHGYLEHGVWRSV